MATHLMRLAITGLLLFVAPLAPAAEVTVTSPNQQLHLKLLTEDQSIQLTALLGDRVIIEPSTLAMTVEGKEITQSAQPGEAQRYAINERYPWRGKHSEAVNHCNGLKLPLKHAATNTAYTLETRVFDTGVAYRTIIEGAGNRAPDETTAFILPAGSTVWFHNLGGHYEAAYEKKSIDDVKLGEWAGPPLTFKHPNDAGYASITEAALINYAGMALEADGQRGFRIGLGHRQPINYPFQLRYGEEEHKRLSKPAVISGTITTPWRVILIGKDLSALVTSDVIHNLCPPPDPKLFPQGFATDWLRPGRAVWKYLDGGGQSNLDTMKDFSRWAGELGFEHNVIEGFWRRFSEDDLKGLVDYAKERNVGTWLWRHTKELRTPEARKELWDACNKAGAVGVKLDFLDHEAKEVVDLYQTLLREAAEHKLMVNFHSANKPAGEVRTWPNELTREAVRGMESSRLKERALHNTILPFTRFLAGHADYTPVHFGDRRGDTTAAHQIATAAIFDSSLLTYGAHPQKLLQHPAVEMIKSIPATWDETRVLPPSDVGEVAVFARRSGRTWFLSIINGPTARKVEVPLTFLQPEDYVALVVSDEETDPAAVNVRDTKLRSTDTIDVHLRSGGGYVARFSPGG